MADFSSTHFVTARKAHRCEHCRGAITPGTRHMRMAGVWQGDFNACRVHDDCHAVWNSIFSEWGDPYDGMLWDLPEVFASSGEKEGTYEVLNELRGFFPHAVCRIEFALRDWITP